MTIQQLGGANPTPYAPRRGRRIVCAQCRGHQELRKFEPGGPGVYLCKTCKDRLEAMNKPGGR